jgi:hypothetical protein
MPQVNDYRSTGQLCQDLQATHASIVKAILALGIEAPIVLNNVAYYSGDQIEKIMAALGIGRMPTPRVNMSRPPLPINRSRRPVFAAGAR